MTRAFTLSFAVLLTAILYEANAASLDCGEQSAADCKIHFEIQLENQIEKVTLKVYRALFNAHLDLWNAVLHDLPEDDPHFPMLQETVKKLREAVPKLNEDFVDPNKMAGVVLEIAHLTEPNFSELNIDEEFERLFDEVKAKNNYEKYREFNLRGINDILIPEISDEWEKLYADLRSTDRETYPQYEDLNGKFQILNNKANTEERVENFRLIISGFSKFFNLPLFKAFEQRQ